MRLIGIFFLLFCSISTAGCIESKLTQESRDQLDQANQRVERLIDYNKELIEKYQAGTLTSAEFKEALSQNTQAIKETKDNIAKASENASPIDIALYGGLGGVVGRTAIHAVRAAASTMPGPWGLIVGQLSTLLLGGSSGRKRKDSQTENKPQS